METLLSLVHNIGRRRKNLANFATPFGIVLLWFNWLGHQFANELIISPKMGSKGANLLSKKSLKSREAIKSPLIDHHYLVGCNFFGCTFLPYLPLPCTLAHLPLKPSQISQEFVTRVTIAKLLATTKYKISAVISVMEIPVESSLHYWLRPITRGQFRFANFAPHPKGKCHFHFLIHWDLLQFL